MEEGVMKNNTYVDNALISEQDSFAINMRENILRELEAKYQLFVNEKHFFLLILQQKYNLDPSKKYEIKNNEFRLLA
jgi:hypothetical protein